MRKAILILLVVLAAMLPGAAHAGGASVALVLAGGPEANMINIWLTSDERSYVIDSVVPLEVGGSVCTHPSGNQNELVCQASQISGFTINSDGGDDQVRVARDITIPVTLRGGGGNDLLVGGGGNDRLNGGDGNDRLIGSAGDDVISGSVGEDVLIGGAGDDVLRGGPGNDVLKGGSGINQLSE
jgi:hypothetical protein